MVDTNVIVYWCVMDPLSERAISLRGLDDIWVAPPIWKPEFRNALAGSIRKKRMGLRAACDAYRQALQDVGTIEVNGLDVMRLLPSSPCTAYDLEFVTLARQLDVPLYTEDRQLLREFPGLARPLPAA